MDVPPELRPNTGLIARLFGLTVVSLRWLVVPAWLAAAYAAVQALPGIGGLDPAPLSGLVPADSPALRTQERSHELFEVPLLSGLVVVARKEGGLSAREQARIVRLAAAYRRRDRLAVPVLNTLRLVPGSREEGTTAITYLFVPPEIAPLEQVATAQDYAKRLAAEVSGAYTGVTGSLAARDAESDAINDSLRWIEVGTVAVIFAVLVISFGSLLAPLLTLLAAGIAFVIAERLVTWTAHRLGLSVPREVEPLMLVLLLGIVTDYAVFFLAGTRMRLAAGAKRVQSARWTAAQYTPIIAMAGLIVALGSATILVSSLDFFRVFGPGLALTVLVGLIVAITLVPALLGILGSAAFWPGGVARVARPDGSEQPGLRGRAAGLVRYRPGAAVVVLVSLATLVAAAWGLAGTRLALTPIRGLDGDAGPARAYHEAALGFAPGIVAPTEIVVESAGIGGRERALRELLAVLAEQAGVAAAVGPGILPRGQDRNLFESGSGDAVRYLLVLSGDPYSSRAADLVEGLEARLPRLLERAGLGEARAGIGGDTALGRDAVGAIEGDLLRIGLAVVLVNVLLLAIFLRGGGRPALPRVGERARPAGLGRARDGRVQPAARLPGPHLLRAADGRRAARLARGGLQPVRRRPDLAGGPAAAGRGGDRRRGTAREPGGHDRGRDPRALVLVAGDRAARGLPRVRLRDGRGHPHPHLPRPHVPRARPDLARRAGQLVARDPSRGALRSSPLTVPTTPQCVGAFGFLPSGKTIRWEGKVVAAASRARRS